MVVDAAAAARAIVAAAVAAVVVAVVGGLVPGIQQLGMRVALTYATYVLVFLRLYHRDHHPVRAETATPAVEPGDDSPDVFSELLDRLH